MKIESILPTAFIWLCAGSSSRDSTSRKIISEKWGKWWTLRRGGGDSILRGRVIQYCLRSPYSEASGFPVYDRGATRFGHFGVWRRSSLYLDPPVPRVSLSLVRGLDGFKAVSFSRARIHRASISELQFSRVHLSPSFSTTRRDSSSPRRITPRRFRRENEPLFFIPRRFLVFWVWRDSRGFWDCLSGMIEKCMLKPLRNLEYLNLEVTWFWKYVGNICSLMVNGKYLKTFKGS